MSFKATVVHYNSAETICSILNTFSDINKATRYKANATGCKAKNLDFKAKAEA